MDRMGQEFEDKRVSEIGSYRAASYDAKSHSIAWELHDGQVDTYGTTFERKGADRAPHVNLLDHHQRSGTPGVLSILGAMINSTFRRAPRLEARFRFSQDNPLAVIAEGMVRDEIIRNGSLGFDPRQWKTRAGKVFTRTKGEPLPWLEAGDRLLRYVILEHSVVGVPSSAGALTRIARAYGVDPERAGWDRSDRPDEFVITGLERSGDGDNEGIDLDELADRIAEKIGERFETIRFETPAEKSGADGSDEEQDVSAFFAGE